MLLQLAEGQEQADRDLFIHGKCSNESLAATRRLACPLAGVSAKNAEQFGNRTVKSRKCKGLQRKENGQVFGGKCRTIEHLTDCYSSSSSLLLLSPGGNDDKDREARSHHSALRARRRAFQYRRDK